jgi:hypothetical protein
MSALDDRVFTDLAELVNTLDWQTDDVQIRWLSVPLVAEVLSSHPDLVEGSIHLGPMGAQQIGDSGSYRIPCMVLVRSGRALWRFCWEGGRSRPCRLLLHCGS